MTAFTIDLISIANGGDPSPDVAWVERSRWEALTSEQQRKFSPLCPDFPLELISWLWRKDR